MIELVASEWLRARSRRIVSVFTIGGALGIVLGMLIAVSQADSFSLDRFPEALEGTASLLCLMTAVLGGSLVGADWSSGSMVTLLAWESRRGRILAVRAAVIAVVVLVVAVGLQSLFALSWWLATAARGSTIGSGGWLGEIAGTIVRISLVGAVFALVAAGAAMITRSTAGSVIGLLILIVLLDLFARGLVPELSAFGLIQSAIVFVSRSPAVVFDERGNDLITVTVARATVTLAGWVVLTLAAGAAAFWRRDAT